MDSAFCPFKTIWLSLWPKLLHWNPLMPNAKNRKLEFIMSFIVWSLQRYEFSSYFFSIQFNITSFV